MSVFSLSNVSLYFGINHSTCDIIFIFYFCFAMLCSWVIIQFYNVLATLLRIAEFSSVYSFKHVKGFNGTAERASYDSPHYVGHYWVWRAWVWRCIWDHRAASRRLNEILMALSWCKTECKVCVSASVCCTYALSAGPTNCGYVTGTVSV